MVAIWQGRCIIVFPELQGVSKNQVFKTHILFEGLSAQAAPAAIEGSAQTASKSGAQANESRGTPTGALKAGGGVGRTVRTGDAPVRGFSG